MIGQNCTALRKNSKRCGKYDRDVSVPLSMDVTDAKTTGEFDQIVSDEGGYDILFDINVLHIVKGHSVRDLNVVSSVSCSNILTF